MKDLLSLRLYTRVARLGSISAAARDCGLSQSQASRIIAELEASLGKDRETNAWGGYSKSTTRILEKLHYLGLIRIGGSQAIE